MAFDPISAIANVADTVIKRIFPDPEQQARAQLALHELHQSGQLAELTSAAGIVKAEAESEHWLVSSWRPITMLWFAGLVGAHWLGYTPENLPQDTVDALLDIVKVGLGGYVVGRSAEKVAKAWKGGG